MIIVNSLIGAIVSILITVINIYTFIVIAAAIVSWFNLGFNNPIVQVLYSLTEPLYSFIRRKIPTTFGMIDIAPVIVLLALQFLSEFIKRLAVSL